MSELLTVKEIKRREELETTIDNGLTSFLEVGTALMEIRQGRLYRNTHKTFEHYCQDRWDMTRQRAHQFIDAAHVVNGLSTTVDKPCTERAIRPLTQLPKKERSAAWEEAVRAAPNGKPSPLKVQEVVSKRLTAIHGKYAADAPVVARPIVSIPPEPEEPMTLDDLYAEITKRIARDPSVLGLPVHYQDGRPIRGMADQSGRVVLFS